MGEPKNEVVIATAEDFLASTSSREELFFVEGLGKYVKLRPPSVEEVQNAQAAHTVDGNLDEVEFGLELFTIGMAEPKIDSKEQARKFPINDFVQIMKRLTEMCQMGEEESKEVKASFRP